jgi:hypothetical protein
VNPEAPIGIASEVNPTNEPEPDLIVLKKDLPTLPPAIRDPAIFTWQLRLRTRASISI